MLFAGAACLCLIASAIWAHYRFAGYDRLPRQFGWNLQPVAYGPRRLVVWLPPAIMIATLGVVAVLPRFMAADRINGDPGAAAIIASAIILGAQAFILWLLIRWARTQA